MVSGTACHLTCWQHEKGDHSQDAELVTIDEPSQCDIAKIAK